MSPVHVIVGQDERAEQMWSAAFTGAVDLYRFERNVDAFERLTAAEAPIDLVVLTPAQQGPFNLTADQFVARVLEGPLGTSRFLANLHVIVVGETLSRTHPRVMAVSTLDAAIRLVKFGEVERAPRPQPAPPVAAEQPRRTAAGGEDMASIMGDLPFAGSVISRIWDAPSPDEEAAPEAARLVRDEVIGGGAPRAQAAMPATGYAAGDSYVPPAPEQASLFARAAAPEFMVPTAPVAQHDALPHAAVLGGGAAIPMVGAPGEAIEVATGLQPARPYQLAQAGYRGPAVRAGQVHGAGHDVGGQPVPPALASQVQSMVYGGVQIGNPNDPLLVWSSAARGEAVPQDAPAPMPMAMPAAQAPAAAAVAPAAPRIVPIDPPAGAYGSPAAAPAPPADPFLARAEQGGGVQFG